MKVPRCLKCGDRMKTVWTFDFHSNLTIMLRCKEHPVLGDFPSGMLEGWLAVMNKEQVT